MLLFLATRIIIFLLWRHPSAEFVANDVSYYGFNLYHLEQGSTDVMREYPPPAVWILHALYKLGGGWQHWLGLYLAAFLMLDGLVAISFFRANRPVASLFWILFTGANGAIMWFRFDLLPAALVAWACLWLATRPRVSGALVGLGAAIKLWPALLIFPMLAPHPMKAPGRDRFLGFLGLGGGLGVVSLLLEGWGRNVDPLTWQSERGLQIESVPATPLMFLRTFTDNPSWPVGLSDYNAIEVYGPGVGGLLQASTVLTALSLVMTGLLTFRLIRTKAPSDSILFAILTVVLATIVVNKTLSPQYILWLGGPVAALLLYARPSLRRHVNVIAVAMIAIGFLTQYTYPWGTMGIMGMPNGSAFETSVLILRNLALIVLLIHAFIVTWQSTRTPTEQGQQTSEELAKL